MCKELDSLPRPNQRSLLDYAEPKISNRERIFRSFTWGINLCGEYKEVKNVRIRIESEECLVAATILQFTRSFQGRRQDFGAPSKLRLWGPPYTRTQLTTIQPPHPIITIRLSLRCLKFTSQSCSPNLLFLIRVKQWLKMHIYNSSNVFQ